MSNIKNKVIYAILEDIDRQGSFNPPKNRLRKVIFKDNTGLSISEKLSIVGKLIGRLNGIKKEDIYTSMLLLNDSDQKITIAKLAKSLKCTPRTIHRHMCKELKQVKEELND